MTRTRVVPILITVVVAALGAWGAELLLVASGRIAFAPSPALGVMLLAISIVVVAMAWPVRQVSRGVRPSATVGFRHAAVVLALAKSSIVVGGIVAGAGLGIALFALTRPFIAEALLVGALVTVGGGVVLLVAGAIAESWCALPPDDGEAEHSAEQTG